MMWKGRLNRLEEAGFEINCLEPSAGNGQAWNFIIPYDKALIKKLLWMKAKKYSGMY